MLAGVVIPRWAWGLLAALALLGGLWVWHGHELAVARREGATAQATADREAYRAAEAVATARQAALVAAQRDKARTISKGTDDALQKRFGDLARSYDDLRLRWAAYQADRGRAGKGAAAGAASAAGGVDDAACKAAGWVSLDVAAAAAEAADTAIAKDDAWIAWWREQAAAWPD